MLVLVLAGGMPFFAAAVIGRCNDKTSQPNRMYIARLLFVSFLSLLPVLTTVMLDVVGAIRASPV